VYAIALTARADSAAFEPVCTRTSPCGVPKGRVGDYAESHSGLPPQTVLDAPGEGSGAHSGLHAANAISIPKSIPKSPNYYAKIAVFCGGLTNA
jgi:hypothetical protein